MARIAVWGDFDVSWQYQQTPSEGQASGRSLSQRNWNGSAYLGGAGTLFLQVDQIITQSGVTGLKLVRPKACSARKSRERLGKWLTNKEANKSLPIVGHSIRRYNKKHLRLEEALGWTEADYKELGKTIQDDLKPSQSLSDKDVLLICDSTWWIGRQLHKTTSLRHTVTCLLSDTTLEPWIVVKNRITTAVDYRRRDANPSTTKEISPHPTSIDSKLVVCVPADDLRAIGLEISDGISWERTLQHLAVACNNGFRDALPIAGLREARYVIVNFGLDGLVLLERSEIEDANPRITFAYHPSSIEGTFERGEPGKLYAGNSWVASFIATALALGPVVKDSWTIRHCLLPALLVTRQLARGAIRFPKSDLRLWPSTGFGALADASLPEWTADDLPVSEDDDKLTCNAFKWWFEYLQQINQQINHVLKTEDMTLPNPTLHGDWAHAIFRENLRQFTFEWQEVAISQRRSIGVSWHSSPYVAAKASRADEFRLTWWSLLGIAMKRAAGVAASPEDIIQTYLDYSLQCLIYGGSSENEFFPDLLNVPYARFGDLVTNDRAEIEAFRSLASVVEEYLASPKAERPLNIAVFGPPGSGKSFGIREVVKTLAKNAAFETFNLSQFSSTNDLFSCFQQIQDMVLDGKLPVIFWDEFDTTLNDVNFGWLHAFLAPMQDGNFVANNRVNHLGRCIFVFAGSRFNRFSDLPDPTIPVARPKEQIITMSHSESEERSLRRGQERISEFELERMEHINLLRRQEFWRLAKGNDFRSRIKAYVDIREPNLERVFSAEEGQFVRYHPDDPRTCDQPAFLIRRARLLRHAVRSHETLFTKQKVQPKLGSWVALREREYGKVLRINEGIALGFLHPTHFLHGSRSLDSVVAASSLTGKSSFERSSLPPAMILSIHVDPVAFERDSGGQPQTTTSLAKEFMRLSTPVSEIGPVATTYSKKVRRERHLDSTALPDRMINASLDSAKRVLTINWSWPKGEPYEDGVDGIEVLLGRRVGRDQPRLWDCPIRCRDIAPPFHLSLDEKAWKRLGGEIAVIPIAVAVRYYRGSDVGLETWLSNKLFLEPDGTFMEET